MNESGSGLRLYPHISVAAGLDELEEVVAVADNVAIKADANVQGGEPSC